MNSIDNNLMLENEQLLKGINDRQHNLKHLSQYLSELESQLALIFASSPDIIVFLDKELKIVKISDAAFSILEYTKEELVGKSVWSFIDESDVLHTKEKFSEIQSNKLVYFKSKNLFVNHWISKSGKKIKLIWRFSICDEREQQTIGVATDITDFETNNIHNFKILQRAMDMCTDGVVITNSQSKNNEIVYANEAFVNMSGYAREELIGQNAKFLQSEECKGSRAITTLKNNIKVGKGCDVLLQNVKKDGTIFYNKLTISAVIEQTIPVNHIWICKDVTDDIGVKYEWSPNTERGFFHFVTKHE